VHAAQTSRDVIANTAVRKPVLPHPFADDKPRSQSISNEADQLAIPMGKFEAHALLALEHVSVSSEESCDVCLWGIINNREVVVADERAAPPSPAWMLEIEPLASALALVLE
jgi:hypothetical protein